MTKATLDEIFTRMQAMGLTNQKKRNQRPSEDDKILHDFEEINLFIDANGYAPGDVNDGHRLSLNERKLAARLEQYHKNNQYARILKSQDRHFLLNYQEKKEIEDIPNSLDDIFNKEHALLSTDTSSATDIFYSTKTPKRLISKTDRVSKRIKCHDFNQFKPLFDSCVNDLVSGKRVSIRFRREQEIDTGDFFILNGIMVLVAEVTKRQIRNGRKNARLRLIFSNGMEGENLLRSLATELYKDPQGRRISKPETEIFSSNHIITIPEKEISGYIYILKSLSKNEIIQELDGGLFKIGYTTSNDVQQRIQNAQYEATYLLAPVQLVHKYKVKNINLASFENLLHRFFRHAQLEIDIKDRFGKIIKPKEWFVLSLDIIEQAIKLLSNSTIHQYRYDSKTNSIVRK
ncbi:MAG: GIY-YIG nuclease family protein [Commensalibacter sp.]|nr:GIY-YIG nuclease family protein [Commensalibacter sp.]